MGRFNGFVVLSFKDTQVFLAETKESRKLEQHMILATFDATVEYLTRLQTEGVDLHTTSVIDCSHIPMNSTGTEFLNLAKLVQEIKLEHARKT